MATRVWLLAALCTAHALFPATIVRSGSVKLLERFGKYKRTLSPGLHWTIPIVDSCRTISTREIVLDTPPQNCISADNAPLSVDAVLYYTIFDPQLCAYGVHNLPIAISNLVRTQIRSEIGKLTLEATFSARETLSAKLLQSIDVATDPWGVRVTRVEIQEIAPRAEIMRSMELQLAAEREKRAAVLKAEGERLARENTAAAEADARVRAAEAERTATVLAAEAAAASTKLRADADADAFEKRRGAARRALCALRDELGADEALRLEALRLYSEANAQLASSKNAKTLVVPRGDEWLARLGVVIGADDAAPAKP